MRRERKLERERVGSPAVTLLLAPPLSLSLSLFGFECCKLEKTRRTPVSCLHGLRGDFVIMEDVGGIVVKLEGGRTGRFLSLGM